MNSNDPTCIVDSLYAAAAVRAVGGDYIGVQPGTAGRVRFVFADPDGQIAQLERDYYQHRLPTVQPAEYVTLIMRLRDDLRAASGEAPRPFKRSF